MAETLVSHFANIVQARLCSITNNNTEWVQRHTGYLQKLCDECLPSGGGFDRGSSLDLARSKANRLVFQTAFHHMTEGMYDGWFEYTVVVTPSLLYGFELKVHSTPRTARSRSMEDHVIEVFGSLLREQAAPYVQRALGSQENQALNTSEAL